MRRVIANIRLRTTEEGGRRQSILATTYGCAVFFENVPELQEHGYDCRMLLAELGSTVDPGDSVEGVPLTFLSADEVMPHMKPGVSFSLWEGKTIGAGTVVSVEDTP
jgi:hypothetical protein